MKFDTRKLNATHEGVLTIAGVSVPCAVLNDGTRVVTQDATHKVLKRGTGGSTYKPLKSNGNKNLGIFDQLPTFWDTKTIKPYIKQEDKILASLVEYTSKNGTKRKGYNSLIIPTTCLIYIKANHDNALHARQIPHAERAQDIIMGLANVGIIGLIDEATGYQYKRERNALEMLLQNYLSKSATKWLKRFPNDYYEQIARLRGWNMKSIQKGNRPSVVGKYTNDFIYSRLAPSMVDSLDQINPQDDNGSRSKKHHQHLQDPAVKELEAQINIVTAFMAASDDWESFVRMIDRVKPQYTTSDIETLTDKEVQELDERQ